MVTAVLLPNAKACFITPAGAPAVGYKLYTYDAGTLVPRATYLDAAGAGSNTNPIILDARGEAVIYWDGSYKAILKDAADVPVWTADNINQGSVAASDGTVAAPSISFLNDRDCGLYRIGANDWAGAANGAKIFEVTATNFLFKGTATNDSAAAGFNGELIEASLAVGAAVALTTATPKTVNGVALTAGDWDVSGVNAFTGNAATTLGLAIASISPTTNVLGTDGLAGYTQNWYNNAAFFGSSSICLPFGPKQISLAAPASIFSVVQASFAVNSCSAYGHLRARRIR